MVRVVVSLDDERIVTAYQDRTATMHWTRGSRSYFRQRCEELEERNESDV